MYKLLLCWRYLCTRYIALASIISVMLGVATMIVVNAVMSGFSSEMEHRLQGVLSDVIVESWSSDGFPDAQYHMDRIREVVGEENIEGMAPTVVVPAAICINQPNSDSSITQPIQLIGIDADLQNHVGDFKQYLQHPSNRDSISFGLYEGGYDTASADGGLARPDMKHAGWAWRRYMARQNELRRSLETPGMQTDGAVNPEGVGGPVDPYSSVGTSVDEPVDPNTPFVEDGGHIFDPATEQHAGAILGIALSAFRNTDPETGQVGESFWTIPGDDVTIGFPKNGMPIQFEDELFTVVDFYESKMSEFDSTFVFIPLETMQNLRGMYDPETGQRYVTQILVNVKDGVDLNEVRDKISAEFPSHLYHVRTWRDCRSDMLAAVQFERAVLNVMLFLIIAVAGFGILAIFFMIVIEKTKDIGILKSLGASSWGVMQIFLGYGLSLGLLGSGIGCVAGLLFVRYINEIADYLSWLIGFEVFNPEIYYFYTIPTIVSPVTVSWIVFGAVMIAVLASVLPAFRAARMHPVRALRYE